MCWPTVCLHKKMCIRDSFRTRIELRQIGVRDEAKMIGGLGICGRELCCASYLSDFQPCLLYTSRCV